MATQLPKGIRPHKHSGFIIDYRVNGKRQYECYPTVAEAIVARIQRLNGVTRAMTFAAVPATAPLPQPTARRSSSWTVQQAFEHIFNTPKARGGWSDVPYRSGYRYTCDVIESFFGSEKPIADIRLIVDPDASDKVQARQKSGGLDGCDGTIDGFIDWLFAEREIDPATVNRYLCMLRKTLKKAKEKGGIKHLPDFPSKLTENNGKIVFLTGDQERKLLSWFIERSARIDGNETAEIMAVLIDTGLRWGEFEAIEPQHLDFDEDTIKVVGISGEGSKNGEIRYVPMTKRVREILYTRSLSGKVRPFNVTHTCMRWRFEQARADLGFEDGVCLHTARHTCATRLVKAGMDTAKVKKWMGHRTIQTTLRYVHLDTSDIREGADLLDKARYPAKRTGGRVVDCTALETQLLRALTQAVELCQKLEAKTPDILKPHLTNDDAQQFDTSEWVTGIP